MPIEITVPRLGWTMEEGTFVAWLKKDGERVRAGEPLFTLEGEKATQEIEATDSGILRISSDAPEPGSVVRVGARLGYLLAEGELVPPEERAAALPDATAIPKSEIPLPISAREQEPNPSVSFAKRIAISPRARRAAVEHGIDWSKLHGTGRTGRIRERDVLAAEANSQLGRAPSPKDSSKTTWPGRVVPISPARRTIARRMSAALHEAAPVTLNARADATELVRAREQLKKQAAASGQAPPTFTDLFVKLAAAALQHHPLLNSQWQEEGIFIPDQINIAFAVDTDDGLVAPVIRDVPGLTIHQVALASRELVEQARTHRLPAEQLDGGTFTVTNLGSLGIDTFTPLLNLPQCAILGIGRITREPVVLENQIAPRDVVSLSLTFDHRIVDGAPAARFLATLRQCIENPSPHISRTGAAAT